MLINWRTVSSGNNFIVRILLQCNLITLCTTEYLLMIHTRSPAKYYVSKQKDLQWAFLREIFRSFCAILLDYPEQSSVSRSALNIPIVPIKSASERKAMRQRASSLQVCSVKAEEDCCIRSRQRCCRKFSSLTREDGFPCWSFDKFKLIQSMQALLIAHLDFLYISFCAKP